MFITTPDNVKLHVEEAGSGTPILFIHEFGGNHLAIVASPMQRAATGLRIFPRILSPTRRSAR
jgi:pimeloyl-ACP methyl ester carboxylesterase